MSKIIKKVALSLVIVLCVLLPPIQAINGFYAAAEGDAAKQNRIIAYTSPSDTYVSVLENAGDATLSGTEEPDENEAAESGILIEKNTDGKHNLVLNDPSPIGEEAVTDESETTVSVDENPDEEPDEDFDEDYSVETYPDPDGADEYEMLIAEETESDEWWPDEPDETEPEETGEDDPEPAPPVPPEPHFVYFKGYYRLADKRYYSIPLSRELQEHCFNMSLKYDVPYEIIMGIMGIETGWNADIGIVVHSGVRYVGLGCLSEIYCAKFFANMGIDIYTPEGNIEAICYTYSEKLREFDGNITYALMAYNMGSGGARATIASGTHSSYYAENAINVAENLLSEAEFNAIN